MPLLGTLQSDDPEKLFVLSLLPLYLSDRALVCLIPLVLALSIVPPRNQLCDALPVSSREVLGLYTSLLAEGMYGPVEESTFFLIPVSLCCVFSKVQMSDILNKLDNYTASRKVVLIRI